MSGRPIYELCLIASLLLLLTFQIDAQTSALARLEPSRLRHTRANRNLALLPRVVPGRQITPAVATRINAILARSDYWAVEQSAGCTELQAEHHAMRFPQSDNWQRDFAVTMRGPRFLSLVITDSYSCVGMPHPDDMTTALIFDLTTGQQVTWKGLLPQAAKIDIPPETDGLIEPQVTWLPLLEQARRQADKECVDAFNDPAIYFTLWPSAKDHALIASPNLTSHFERAVCGGDEIKLSITQAHALGVTSEVLEALSHSECPRTRRAGAPHPPSSSHY